MKKYGYKIAVVGLILILLISIFYMVIVHVPYYNYHHQLDVIRNEICEKNNYEYDNYFNQHNGKEIYYVLRVKVDNKRYYVAFNEDKELVESLKEPFAKEEDVLSAIEKKYDVKVDDLDVGYENGKFVYTTKIMNEKDLTYIYYSLETGEFVKSYYIED